MTHLDTTRPFRRQAALAAGIGAKRLRGPGFQRVLPGIWLSSHVQLNDVRRTEAALATVDGPAHASHASAARLLGIPLPTFPEEYVTVPTASARAAVTGVRYIVRQKTETQIIHGLRISVPTQIFEELAALLPLVDLVVVGDHLVRRHGITCQQLRDGVAAMRGRAGRHARRAASHIRADVDSAMETRLRMLIVLAGIPEPEVNVRIRDTNGELLRRHDLGWPTVRVIVEYDGRVHIERESCWERDVERREATDADHWRTLTVVSSGIYRSPGVTVQKVYSVLQARRLPGLPTRLRPDWQPHFPGHGVGGP